ncbi:MAG TPA: DUF5681 domain-containing protein [Candidatus Sulfotelmatobacter sp.]|nr:DUF5681 domain-containing protein [Candidatus Sulfotelmatobacter sp.]
MGAASRDARGRFEPGHSGNPAGKQPGTLNRATVLARALAAGDAERIAQSIVERALAGDMVAARFVLARIDPRPRGRAVELDLPADAPLAERFDAVLAELAAGRITPDEALTLARFLERHGRVTCGADRLRGGDADTPTAPAPADEPASDPAAADAAAADDAPAIPASPAQPVAAAVAVDAAPPAQAPIAPAARLHSPSILAPAPPIETIASPPDPPLATRRRAALARAGTG